jgi:hypothetical protein
MLISSTYICPVRGLAALEPPEPIRLRRAAKVAENLGVKRLIVPVLEESLLGAGKRKIGFLDRLLHALDQMADKGMTVWLIAPARRVLGLDWVPPYLVKAVKDLQAGQVYLEGQIRNLWPYNWWEDMSIIQTRIKIFRELVAAISRHPALKGWIIMDRALEWSRPDHEVADLVLKSYVAEIRERDEGSKIYLGLGWAEFFLPETAQGLSHQVDGLRMSGLENPPPGVIETASLIGELKVAAYLGTMAQWLFGRPAEVEVGWNIKNKADDPEEILEAFKRLSCTGLAGINWVSLVDPELRLYSYPPWVLRPGLERIGLLDQGLEPKDYVETWLNAICSITPRDRINDFIDISVEEYLADPHTHFLRLWDHFQE